MAKKIGILHPGEMGFVVASSARNSGHEVYWASEGRSPESAKRAAAAGLSDAGSVPKMCEICPAIVSVCPPEFAKRVARDVADRGFRGLYIDANAISPQHAREIGDMLTKAGIDYVDGGIIGLPAKARGETWLYLAGPSAAEAASYFTGGPLEIGVLEGEAGQASALKMCFAANTKGRVALLTAVEAAAESLGVRGALEKHWAETGTKLDRRQIERCAPKAWRWAPEMIEIAETLESTGMPGGFHRAAGELYQRLAEFKGCAPSFEEMLKKLTT